MGTRRAGCAEGMKFAYLHKYFVHVRGKYRTNFLFGPWRAIPRIPWAQVPSDIDKKGINSFAGFMPVIRETLYPLTSPPFTYPTSLLAVLNLRQRNESYCGINKSLLVKQASNCITFRNIRLVSCVDSLGIVGLFYRYACSSRIYLISAF